MHLIRTLVAWLILVVTYLTVLMIATVARTIRRRRSSPNGRILVTGTFYNRNWFLSHAIPLGRCGARDVVFIADEPQEAPDGVRVVCPPRWLATMLGRAASKLAWLLVVGARLRPDVCMGYHIFPGGVSALISARILGCAAAYQMTGGPIEVQGGGNGNENVLMSMLRKPSAFLERLALEVVRRFDLVVVRGGKAKAFLANNGIGDSVCVIPGGVESSRFVQKSGRVYDFAFVGRLTEIKQPIQFVQIVAEVRKTHPSVRAVMVGGGRMLDAVRQEAVRLGVGHLLDIVGKQDAVEDVLARSRIFVITSRTEGLSIAMMEAMAAGLPVIAANVGELGDLVLDGQTGWLVTPDRIEEYARRIQMLLSDQSLWGRFSARAREVALHHAAMERVAEKWRRAFAELSERCETGLQVMQDEINQVGTHAA